MELVTEPEFSDVDEVVTFLKEVQRIVRYLGISTADMEKGSMRLEANVSIRNETDANLPNYKVELKNINSFRFVKAAIQAEIDRQIKNPDERHQETRGYDEKTKTTFLQRSKENAHDYRYFPEPALLVKKVYELLKKDYASDIDTKSAVEKVVESNQKAVKDFQDGKGEVVSFLIGQVQKELKGKGEPKLVQELLRKLLTS